MRGSEATIGGPDLRHASNPATGGGVMAETTTGERYRVSFVPFPGIFQVIDQETGEAATAYRTLPEARAQLAAMRAKVERPALELKPVTIESPQLMPSIDDVGTLDMFEEFG